MVVTTNIIIFWDMILCSLTEVYHCFCGMYCHHHQSSKTIQAISSKRVCSVSRMLACLLSIFSILKMEVVHFSEMSVNCYQTASVSHSPKWFLFLRFSRQNECDIFKVFVAMKIKIVIIWVMSQCNFVGVVTSALNVEAGGSSWTIGNLLWHERVS
jgi:hypothetical protein